MLTKDTTLFRMASQRLNWLGERQNVLSQNIANADTPGYRARDLAPQTFRRELDSVRHIGIAQTSANHIVGTLSRPDHRVEEEHPRNLYEINPTGNGVILEEQIMQVTETNMNYQLTTNLYQKNMMMFRTAIGHRGN